MQTRKTKLGLLGLLMAPALLTGCPIYVDSWEVYDSTYGSPDVVIVGEASSGWIDIDRPKFTSKKGALNPVIQSFTANITQVQPGQPITFTVVAHDPQDQPLQFNWAATGGTMSGNTGQVVSWDPPEKAGIYTVSVIVSNARGGATTGALNLTVKAATPDAKPTATPAPAETPAPTPSPKPTTAPTPKQTAAPSATPAPAATPTASASATPTPAASATATPAAKAELTVVTGVVKDDAGALAGAEVLLTSGDAKVVFEAKGTTDAEGRYKLTGVPTNARMILSARKAGYAEKLRTITPLAQPENVFDFVGTFALQKI